MRIVPFVIALSVLGCRSADEAEPTPVDLARFDACAANQVPVLGGGCTTIGVPVDGCAEGFTHDGDGGCTPVLPETSCPAGQMAIPGETRCREVSPCGEGTFGAIPVEADTLFVDASVAASGDGSRASPFKTIDEALAKVRRGTRPIIAVAAGVYTDAVIDVDVRLIGRCPTMVEIRGTDPVYPAVDVSADAEVRGVAVTGPGSGIVEASGGKLAVSDVWVHAMGKFGMGVQSVGATGEHPMTVQNALVEDVKEEGFFAFGGAAIVEKSIFRDSGGLGVRAELYAKSNTPAKLELRRSLVERAHEGAVVSLASKVDVFGTVVRDTLSRASDKRAGVGAYAAEYPKTKARGELNLTQSFITRSLRAGLYYDNSIGRIDRTVVRDGIGMEADGRYGDGGQFLFGANVQIVDSLFVANRNAGLAFAGANGTVERTIVRDTRPSQTDRLGFGIAAWNASITPSDVTVRTSLVSKAHDSAISVGGSHMTIEASALLDTVGRSDGLFGDGFTITTTLGPTVKKLLMPASATVSGSLIARNARAGVFLDGAALELRDSAIECNRVDVHVTDEIATLDTGEKVDSPWTLTASGEVTCGCGTKTSCRGQTTTLRPAEAPTYD